MVKNNYQAEPKADEKKVARAILKNKRASLKYSTEISRELANKTFKKAEAFLEGIVAMERHLPLRKYNKKIAHRKGNSASGVKTGKYPVNTAKIFLELLQNLKANSDYKGLDADKMVIRHVFASQGLRRFKFQAQGRISGKRRLKKSVHIEGIAVEGN